MLNIESLGSVKDLAHENLTPGVNAIIGKNGTGKSTTRNALTFILFGLPSFKENVPHVAPSFYSDKNQIRRISATISDGSTSVKVTRMSQDKKASEDLVCEPSSKEELFASYLGSVSKDDFLNVWSMSEFDINAIDPSNSSAIEHFLASQYGIHAAPHTIKEELQARIKEHDSADKTKSGFARKKKEYLETYKDYLGLQQTSHETFKASQELEAAIQSEEKCTVERNAKTTQVNELAELKKSEQSLRNNLHEATLKQTTLRKQLENLNASRPQAPNKELLALQFKIKSLPKDLENYTERKNRLNELKAEQQISEHELAAYPSIAFSHTSADWAFAQTRSQEIVKRISEAKFKYESDEAYVEQKQAQNELFNGEENNVHTFSFGMVALLVGTPLAFLALAAALYFTSLPPLVAGSCAAVGLIVTAIEFAIITTKSKKTTTPSAEARHAQNELASLMSKRDASKTTWQRAEDEWTAFVAQHFPQSESTPRDELMRAIQSAPEILMLEKRIEENRQKITEGMQFLLGKESTFKSDYSKCYPGETAPDDFALLVARCGSRIDEEIQTKESYDSYTSRKNELEHQSAEIAETIKKLRRELLDLSSQLSCPESDIQDFFEHRISELKNEIAYLNEQIAQHNKAIGQNRQIIEDCFDQDDSERTKAALQNRLAEVYSQAHDMLVTKMAEHLLKNALEYFDKHSAPPIIDESNKIFARITQGQFPRIFFPQEKPESETKELTVIDKNGSEFTPDTLSLGTMRQLYLAIRFGVIQAQSKNHINVPIVLDEILASFDEDRRDAAVAEINELAKDHQVFYFSTRDDIIENPETNSWNIVRLKNT